MAIVILILILALLIFIHELGHFLAAKLFNIKVEEFALGFPPKIFGIKRGETEYKLNLLPFGGYVKIYGENPDAESLMGPDRARSMSHQPKWKQAVVLLAGIFFNLLLAWGLVSIGFMIGLPTSQSAVPAHAHLKNPQVTIVEIYPESPAAIAELKSGDVIKELSLTSNETISAPLSPEGINQFIFEHQGEELSLEYIREKENKEAILVSAPGFVEGKEIVGITTDVIGTVKLSFFRSIGDGFITTCRLTGATVVAFVHLIGDAFKGDADIQTLTGPVGLVGVISDSSALGFVYVLLLISFISINLAVINLFPFPALDGGRVLFLGIEAIKRSPIRPQVANWLNTIGFVLLILLMIVVTFHDITNLF